MGAYFHRSWEIGRGIYYIRQLFQPVGFTLWSLWIRDLGGFELFKWTQIFLSWGTVFLIFLIARNRFGNVAGIASLVLAGLHVPQAAFATFHMAETFYAFVITLTFYFALKALANKKLSYFFTVGFLLSLAFYFKGNHAYFIPLFALWLFYRERKSFSSGFKKVFVMGLGCLLVTTVHMAWTWQHYQKPFLGPMAGALNFVEGKCPSKDNIDSTGARWMSPLFGILNETTVKIWPRPFTDQSYFWNEGFKCVQENPFVLVESLRYIYYLFGGNDLWPIMTNATRSWYIPWEYFFHYGLLPLALLGALSLARKKDDFTEISALMMLSLFFTVWFFKSENRFRVPFDGILLVWGSVGVAWLAEQVKALVFKGTKISAIDAPVEPDGV
ncbi:ArnT family glycosyltransferase [Bdellovibrio bacteriovorus]|uniref:ArnT family glycosyltransferase n=1 Tax=Bdellovibrio bacteriovorus TaxID=959 RepID=UPI0035A73E7C